MFQRESGGVLKYRFSSSNTLQTAKPSRMAMPSEGRVSVDAPDSQSSSGVPHRTSSASRPIVLKAGQSWSLEPMVRL
jgi:hypothetical protein